MARINFAPLDLSTINEDCIGKPVQHREKSDRVYGIITGYDDSYVHVHFGKRETSLLIKPINLYLPTFK